jgi:hypothetical protein
MIACVLSREIDQDAGAQADVTQWLSRFGAMDQQQDARAGFVVRRRSALFRCAVRCRVNTLTLRVRGHPITGRGVDLAQIGVLPAVPRAGTLVARS